MKLDEPLPTEDAFFAALLEGNVQALQRLLASDFVIVDVMRGAEVGRSAFLDAIGAQHVRFTTLRVVERRLRRYGSAAVVVGRTAMSGDFAGEPFTAASRYTHVFVRSETNGWQLVSAQGTQIVD